MHARAGVGRARAAGDEGDSGAAGHLAVGIGHIADTALLPANGDRDFRSIVKCIEDGEEALARNGENPVAAVDLQLVDEDSSACSCGHGARCSRWQGK